MKKYKQVPKKFDKNREKICYINTIDITLIDLLNLENIDS